MKIVKLSLIVVAAIAAVVFGLSTMSYAFHSGGVAECMGCHNMHGAAGPGLLVGSDQSSTCLTCHAGPTLSSYHVMTDPAPAAGTAPANLTPGGDFGWLKKSYYFAVRNSPNSEEGETHGHNIISADKGYTVDSRNATAPGGTFNSNNLMCNSCHDQHGQVRRLSDASFARTGAPIIGSGSYGTSSAPAAGQAVGTFRLLRSSLSDQTHAAGGPTFVNTPVVAFTPSTYNRTEAATMTRTEYNSEMSAYCGSCHTDMHSTAGILRHPAGAGLTGGTLNNYNTYVKSGDLNGSSATAYNSLVPFEQGLAVSVANLATLQTRALNTGAAIALEGPMATGGVMCLSCHRAHASGFPEMTRWNNEGEFMMKNGFYPGTDSTDTDSRGIARGKTVAETSAAYYNKPITAFATFQRSLCNKCHAKD
jgi:predicted CXXCH cytochrome family protein